jgi:hypothetical protein
MDFRQVETETKSRRVPSSAICAIPSHDRFNAILAAIKPAEFEACLLNWIADLHGITSWR